MTNNVFESYYRLRLNFFAWRSEANLVYKISLALCMACLTGLLAQVRIYLPWTPIPIVASQFGVIFAAVILGKRWGGIGMIFYAVLGFAGIPWFAGLKGGITVLTGPTAGYTIGYIMAAFFIGYFTDSFVKSRKLFPLFGIILFSQLFLIYIPGLIHLGLWLKIVKGSSINIPDLLWMGYIPFIVGDLIKSISGALIIKCILPMEDFRVNG